MAIQLLEQLQHADTHAFGKIVTDYLANEKPIQAFYNVHPTIENISGYIATKAKQDIDRDALADALKLQYKQVANKELVSQNIEALRSANAYTICTAHQAIIFGGPLYFVYKIAHTIKLAQALQAKNPNHKFVPVFYIGSEDADIDEIGTCTIADKTYTWQPDAKGATGRMSMDSLQTIADDIIAHLDWSNDFGQEIKLFLQATYTQANTLGAATLQLVHWLFGKYGLVVLDPDNRAFKKIFAENIKTELVEQASAALVEATNKKLELHYKSQAFARPINLFYLGNNIRERIVLENDVYVVQNTDIQFSEEAIIKDVDEHPENYSPNVILRGVFQEKILPNVAFIGGGGELAYWLQLKEVFALHNVPMPPIVLRQSFLIASKQHLNKLSDLQLHWQQLFLHKDPLLKYYITNNSAWKSLEAERQLQAQLMKSYKEKANAILPQLVISMQAYEARYNKLQAAVEKKFIAHAKRKDKDNVEAITKVKEQLFPKGNLQERVDNFIPYYNAHGAEFIEAIINNTDDLGSTFNVLVSD